MELRGGSFGFFPVSVFLLFSIFLGAVESCFGAVVVFVLFFLFFVFVFPVFMELKVWFREAVSKVDVRVYVRFQLAVN